MNQELRKAIVKLGQANVNSSCYFLFHKVESPKELREQLESQKEEKGTV